MDQSDMLALFEERGKLIYSSTGDSIQLVIEGPVFNRTDWNKTGQQLFRKCNKYRHYKTGRGHFTLPGLQGYKLTSGVLHYKL